MTDALAPQTRPTTGAATADRDPLRDAWERDGFIEVPALVEGAALEELRAAYDDILERRVEIPDADFRLLGGVTRQIKFPDRYHPTFRRNAALTAAREVAARVLDCEKPRFFFSMLIHKPPGHLATTPWHQDMAYAKMPFAPAGIDCHWREAIQFWLAIDDADVENGCMHFIPGEHDRPLRPHRIASGDPNDEGRLLQISEPERHLDLSKAVARPLRAGGATGHSEGTPHFTPGNRSADRPRRAYIFNFARPDFLERYTQAAGRPV